MNTQPEFYRIVSNGEWAHITIEESTGTFLSVGSYGTYGYVWYSIGSQSLKSFLASLDRSYFLEKVSGYNWREFSFDETIKSLKHNLFQNRRHGWVNQEDARAAWSALEHLEYTRDATYFLVNFTENDALTKVWSDYTDIACTAPRSDCIGFWEVIWPAFIEQIAQQKAA